ncbi:hypothetical protein H311_01225 [Anncaliia algerae PRA109]|nr:hypothetical protein H311_01225 [Anncaliia algerae PRA109]
MPKLNFSNNKLGGPESILQIGVTMLNYKNKSHRGRSPHIRTDSLCIVEYKERIVRLFSRVIPNKEASTLIPIITRNVANNSLI